MFLVARHHCDYLCLILVLDDLGRRSHLRRQNEVYLLGALGLLPDVVEPLSLGVVEIKDGAVVLLAPRRHQCLGCAFEGGRHRRILRQRCNANLGQVRINVLLVTENVPLPLGCGVPECALGLPKEILDVTRVDFNVGGLPLDLVSCKVDRLYLVCEFLKVFGDRVERGA